MATERLKIVVPMEPPSGGHYMKYRVMPGGKNNTGIVMAYPSKEAKAWWKAVHACVGGQILEAKMFEIAYVVYQGSGSRGDVDNYAKCVLDGIARAGAIHSDHYVTAIHGYKARDRENPRTEIFIVPAGQISLFDPPMPKPDDW